jgi:hypothetical protein
MTIIYLAGALGWAALLCTLGYRFALRCRPCLDYHYRQLGRHFIKVAEARLKPMHVPRAIVFVGVWWILALLMIVTLATVLGPVSAALLTIFPGSIALYWGARHITRWFQ